MKSKRITDLNHEEAKVFFMDEKNYINFDIPEYFHFSKLLDKTSELIKKKSIGDICKKNSEGKPDWPKNYEGVNYTFLSNKDGAFAWRPLQLIHPVLYVDLVNTITDEDNWKKIVNRFQKFANSSVECISIPRISQNSDSHKSSQVRHWWEEMEQRSIKMALQYDYVFTTDITNCYGAIYTHSIEWALNDGGKKEAKSNINSDSNRTLGSLIDQKICNMNHGQTNGIPQGSVLMDFIAEIVLGYADIELTNFLNLEKIEGDEFCILRYRDDYRIFVNNPAIGNQILKHLNKVLYDLGMKMNPDKTSESNDVILSSIKPEKLERVFIAPKPQYYQKEALRIYQLSKKHPNSGIISGELSDYYDRIEKSKYLKNTNIEVLISIFSMIAFSSPNVISWVSAILSVILKMMKDNTKRGEIIKKIHQKFKRIPNTSLIDVWLQRIAAPQGIEIEYKDDLTKSALQKIDNIQLWGSLWLNDEIAKKINLVKISKLNDQIKNKTISPVIIRAEVELFKLNYNN